MPELEVLIILTWKYGFQNIQVLSHGFIPCSDWGLMDGRVEIDFKYWTAEWEKQQNAHVPNREERFQFMLWSHLSLVVIELICLRNVPHPVHK